jgi:hypothetical protein
VLSPIFGPLLSRPEPYNYMHQPSVYARDTGLSAAVPVAPEQGLFLPVLKFILPRIELHGLVTSFQSEGHLGWPLYRQFSN